MDALIPHTYSIEQFITDAAICGAVCFVSYQLCFHASFRYLMWRNRRNSSN
jgi:hypothetical protein